MSLLIVIIFFKSICLCMQQLVLAVYERFLNPRHKYYWSTVGVGNGGADGGTVGASGSGAGAGDCTGGRVGRRAGLNSRRSAALNSSSSISASGGASAASHYQQQQQQHQTKRQLPKLHDERVWGKSNISKYCDDSDDIDDSSDDIAGRSSYYGRYVDYYRSALTPSSAAANERREHDCELLLQQIRARRKRTRVCASRRSAF